MDEQVFRISGIFRFVFFQDQKHHPGKSDAAAHSGIVAFLRIDITGEILVSSSGTDASECNIVIEECLIDRPRIIIQSPDHIWIPDDIVFALLVQAGNVTKHLLELCISSTIEIIIYEIRIKPIELALDEIEDLLSLSSRDERLELFLECVRSDLIVFIQKAVELRDYLLVKLRKEAR